MKACVVLFLLLASACAHMSLPEDVLQGDDLRSFFKWPAGKGLTPGDAFRAWLTDLDTRFRDVPHTPNGDGYFKWIPIFQGAAIPHTDGIHFSTPCFNRTEVKVTLYSTKVAELTVTSSIPSLNPACPGEDFYLIATLEGLRFLQVNQSKEHKFTWIKNETSTLDQWVERNGYRVFRFPGAMNLTLEQVKDTISLFFPALIERTISAEAQARNVEFLRESSGYDMPKRTTTDVLLDESQINDGDFFGVIRLDGLDPMLAWAMGAQTGHTTIALRIDGVLYICESTTNSNYWPVNGIQKTKYTTWLEQAKAASLNVVHLPLSPESRAKFNATKAAEWFTSTVEGLNYGFQNMLFAWVDLAEDNYPYPLVSQEHEILAGLAQQLDSNLSSLMWGSAFNQRLGTEGLLTADAIVEAYERGMTFEELFAMPEQDKWKYSTGYSLVCDVLVCETWKAGGLFGNLSDSIQCTEFTNWDAYTLNIFDSNYVRPAACVAADPDLPVCQILGDYRMKMPQYNSRPLVANMAEKCPRGDMPMFDKPAGC